MTVRTRFRLVIGIACWLGAAACASRPDVRGDNSDAREWAEKQKQQDAEAERQGRLPPYRQPAPPAPPPAASPPQPAQPVPAPQPAPSPGPQPVP